MSRDVAALVFWLSIAVVVWLVGIAFDAYMTETGRQTMSRETLQLEAWRFTSISALAREIDVLLSDSNYKLEILLTAKEAEQLAVITEGWRTLGRVKLHVGAKAIEANQN